MSNINTLPPMETNKLKVFIKGYKERCYPTLQQEILFTNTYGCCRFVYNQLLANLVKEYKVWLTAGKPKETKPKMSKFDLAARLPALSREHIN